MKKTILAISVLIFATLGVNAQEYHLGQVVTNPDGSQGVVFYLNEDGTSGWMVALHDASTACPWGPAEAIEGLDNVNLVNFDFLTTVFLDNDGFDHTQKIRAHCENMGYTAPYAAGLVDLENGWYLPSAGQLKWLYINAVYYESALQSVGEKMGLSSYWSSTAQTDGKAWIVLFGAPYPMSAWANNGYFYAIDKDHNYDQYDRSIAVRAVRDLDFSPLPFIGMLQTPAILCDEGPLELVLPNLYNTESYGWEIAPDETFTDPVAYTGQSLDTTYNGWQLRLWATNEEGTKYSNTVPISVLPSKASELTLTSCDPYTWNDSTYTQSGVYQQTFTSINSCDSIVTLHLTVGTGPDLSEIQGPDHVYVGTFDEFTYRIDSVPDAYGYEWRIDNDWPLTYSSDSPQCNVGLYTKGRGILTVRVYGPCGFSEQSLLIRHDLEPEIMVSPNPNLGTFTLTLYGLEGPTVIEFYNYLGQLIDRRKVESILNGYTVPYSLIGKAAGVYLISVTNGHHRYFKKVVKSTATSYGVVSPWY